MKLEAIREIVRETSRRLDEKRVADLKRTVEDRKSRVRTQRPRSELRSPTLRGAEPAPTRGVLERQIGDDDLVSVNYLKRAQLASRSVCRLVLRDASGNERGYATGFLVAPGVLMTNHHVFGRPEEATHAFAEFRYEHDVDGNLEQGVRFRVAPGRFFLADRQLDVALCGVEDASLDGATALAGQGFLRVLGSEPPLARGDFVTIIQHPSGRPKQIALRENELLTLTDSLLTYTSDTAPGSSGSPVFNDSWQIVGLHHSGVPRTNAAGDWLLRNGDVAGPEDDDADVDWIANEGVRTDRIVEFVRARSRGERESREFLAAVAGDLEPEPLDGPRVVHVPPPAPTPAPPAPTPLTPRVEPTPGGARVTVPLSFHVSIDGVPTVAPAPPSTAPPRVVPADAGVTGREGYKKPKIDENYANRRGYKRSRFLGRRVPMPMPVDESTVTWLLDGSGYEIPYEHFSVVMDRRRRMALFTAANVDGRRRARYPEPGRTYTRKALNGFTSDAAETWIVDPRIPEDEQLPDAFYTKDRQAFDKGHLVRRDVVCWGDSYAQVQRANGDSFHLTNCSPQVKDFNRAPGAWGSLENAVMENAEQRRVCVFSGPLFRRNDRWFDGVQGTRRDAPPLRVKIPRTYWKVIVSYEERELRSYAFLLSQDLGDVPFRVELDFADEWRTSMVSLEELDRWTPAIEFPYEVLDADQYHSEVGHELAAAPQLGGLERLELARIAPELDLG